VKAGIGKDKAAILVVIGALRDCSKRVLAVESGYRESTVCWAGVLRNSSDPAPKVEISGMSRNWRNWLPSCQDSR